MIYKKILQAYMEYTDKPNFRYYLKNKYPNEFEYLMSKENWFSSEQLLVKLYILINELKDYPECKCGNKIKRFNKEQFGFIKTCTDKSCEYRKKENAKKKKEMCLEKYGVENQFQRKEIKDKIKKRYDSKTIDEKNMIIEKRKQTNLEKYNVTAPAKNKKILEKMKQTNLEKYGVSTILEKRELIEKSINDKYGVKNPMQFEEIKKKMLTTTIENNGGIGYQTGKSQDTMMKKYGVKNPMHNDIIKDKLMRTNLERYGVKSVLSLDSIRNSSKDTWDKKMKLKIKSFDTLEAMFDFDTEYNGVYENYEWKCECGTVFESNLEDGKYPKCPTCFPYVKSKEELNLKQYIESLGFKVLHNKKPFGKFEIDLLIPDEKVAIEYNGLYWHSDDKIDKQYHLDKTKMVEENDYNLFHVYEHQWLNKPNIIKSMIKSKLGLNKKIYARNCEIKEINSKTKNLFLESNHLQGVDKSSVKLGLFHNDELVMVMTFNKPKFTKKTKYDYELFRMASKLNTAVVGGASKLFKHFIKKYKPNTIISYADRSHSIGNVYEKIGFELSHISPPNFWVYGNEVKIPQHRMNWQKHKLNDKLDVFDPNLTAWENMKKNNYKRYWDSGNLVYVWKR